MTMKMEFDFSACFNIGKYLKKQPSSQKIFPQASNQTKFSTKQVS